MPDMEGLEVMRRIRALDPTLPVVVLSGDADLSAVLGAVRQGAFDYVVKDGSDIRPLQAAIERAVAHARLARENLRLTYARQRANEELEARVCELDEKRRLLEQAQAQSEALLRNILPDVIVERLKEDDQAIADGFSEVTVLFADIVGFTRLAADRTPIDIVALLNEIFSRFDHLVEEHGLEKIKTIGDAYMAASGLPVPRPDHAEAAANMALGMLRVIAALQPQIGAPVGVRIGMHSGPVVAGVIGTKKFIYDIWGDTVNVASRMEACSVPGRIQITDETRARLGRGYRVEERGLIEVKGKGTIRTWFLIGRSPSP
jgi:adenylate cyclase